jgi:hypothetical protein
MVPGKEGIGTNKMVTVIRSVVTVIGSVMTSTAVGMIEIQNANIRNRIMSRV